MTTPDDGADGTDATDTGGADGSARNGAGGRSVEVPMRVYKTVTVFGTLFAIVFVLGGFVLLDAATNSARAPLGEVDPVLAVLGLLAIVAGAAVYVLSTRFRAPGMGSSKDEEDQSPDDD